MTRSLLTIRERRSLRRLEALTIREDPLLELRMGGGRRGLRGGTARLRRACASSWRRGRSALRKQRALVIAVAAVMTAVTGGGLALVAPAVVAAVLVPPISFFVGTRIGHHGRAKAAAPAAKTDVRN